jgi:GNAT superfamily N-acetyltransferase
VNATPIQIRRLTEADAAAYRAIRLEGLRDSPEAFGSTFEAENEHLLEWFANRLANAEVFGAFRGADLLGVAGLFIEPGPKVAHKARLWGMYVQPATRNEGLGRSLAEAVIAAARKRVEMLQLAVVSGNESARQLYLHLGFVEYGIERHALKQGERYYDESLMAMDLTPDSHPAAAPAPKG